MAGLFQPTSQPTCKLLDAGAGIGSLSSAFVERCVLGNLRFSRIDISAFEIDVLLHPELQNTLEGHAQHAGVVHRIFSGDFIENAVNAIQFQGGGDFSHAILNPPYKKISGDSRERLLLREVGLETVNFYSAFVALSLMLMASGGQVVAIIPRSFCNGPYYLPFRRFVLQNAAIHHLHLFESRDKAFEDDGVLQENVIVLFERGGRQGNVTVTTSTDDRFDDLSMEILPFEQIVHPGDTERVIYVPTPSTIQRPLPNAIRHSLSDIEVNVSTGPVVDFRLAEHLRAMPGPDTAPLLYPVHLIGQRVEWPKAAQKKPNAIARNTETEKWLYPNGFYCVVRRFSSKEEKRRIVATVVTPRNFADAERLGFENHLNVFHGNKRGLPEALAYGLATFLNTTAVDQCFRSFNGHTQVNATDLKRIRYPSREALIALGEVAGDRVHDQETIDRFLEQL